MSKPTDVAVDVGNDVLSTDMVAYSTVSDDAITGDLIDLTESSTNATFKDEQLGYSDVTTDHKLESV